MTRGAPSKREKAPQGLEDMARIDSQLLSTLLSRVLSSLLRVTRERGREVDGRVDPDVTNHTFGLTARSRARGDRG